MTRVLIAAESEMHRRSLESLVASTAWLELAGSLDDLSELADSIDEAAPDVVLLASESSVEELLQEAAPAVRGDVSSRPSVIALVSEPQEPFSLRWLRGGIAAWLPRDATAEEILASVRAAASGLLVVHREMLERDGEHVTFRNSDGPIPQLTVREIEILTMLAEGLGNKEIAWRLKISGHTVKFHISSIFTKLDVGSRAEAVSLGFRLGLILI
jgi:NarL family two-component system response regulator YdfI